MSKENMKIIIQSFEAFKRKTYFNFKAIKNCPNNFTF